MAATPLLTSLNQAAYLIALDIVKFLFSRVEFWPLQRWKKLSSRRGRLKKQLDKCASSVNALVGLVFIDPDLIWLLLADVYYSKKREMPLPPTSYLPEDSQGEWKVYGSKSLCSVTENHLKPCPWNHQVEQFCEEPLDSLKFFIRKCLKGPKSPFRELDIKAPICTECSIENWPV
ncbi:hypothetical protein Vadar_009229 [Vaccinium darrowii]|uniref:Uncharacterized protein n=1 Tax=Vaccinium darrowii TaxID=229202 RepID=A0ACB7YK94_9ERIC|nr:hypothetical protein Vadar_009229 [Vaccinium darrowii]